MTEFQGQWPYEPQPEALIRQRQPGSEGIYNPDPYKTLSELISTILPFEQQRQGLTDWRSQDTANEAMMWMLPSLTGLGRVGPKVASSVSKKSKPLIEKILENVKSQRGSISNKPLKKDEILSEFKDAFDKHSSLMLL